MPSVTIESDIPQRLDRLPWSSWHMRILTALGTSWILDGLEVTLVGSLSGILESAHGLRLTDPEVTGAATTYLAGAVLGALLFGYLTDRLGRRKLFLVTLATYSLATVASAFSGGVVTFSLFRFFTGVGIGGEYAAINSAVDELIPGKLRGTVDLIVNGTFWLGATVGSFVAMYLLGNHLPHFMTPSTGWRYAFGLGGSLGLIVLVLRLFVPESPRWLMLRGHEDQAGKIVADIEDRASHGHPDQLPPPEGDKLKITVRDRTPFTEVFKNMAGDNRERSMLGLVLMVSRASSSTPSSSPTASS
jgi:MFS family permease